MSRYTRHDRELKISIKAIVIVVSSSRYKDLVSGKQVEDPSGDLAVKLLTNNGIDVVDKIIVPDNITEIRRVIYDFTDKVNLILLIGGTGVTRDDVTLEAVKPLLDKELPTFSQLFTLLSYEDVGTAVLPSRTTAGIKNRTLIFCIPGSIGAVNLALNKIIIPELGHLINMLLNL